MRSFLRLHVVVLLASLLVLCGSLLAQTETPQVKSQEISEIDGIPVLIKHLPDWEKVRPQAIFTNNIGDLRKALGDRPVFDLVDFTGGTEAVTAPYSAGRLLIIEYSNPQASVDADSKFLQRLSEIENDRATVYRRIGNYNVFVFDAADERAATALFEQVKYEKNVQWLGEDPFLFKQMERAFINTTSDIFLSTVIVIILGIGFSIVSGLIVGIVYFHLRERRRAAMSEFSDAGGMIRLNLDGFTPNISSERLLKD